MSNHDMLVIVPVAILAIGILLALVLRSLVAPLYLIVSVALSYLAALGLAVIAFGGGGLLFVMPFFMFIFLLALGEDYNILVMTRIREEAAQRPLREAVVTAIGRTGSTVTAAGLLLGGTFAVLGLSGSGSYASETRQIGFGLAAGILMDTFLVRTLLVPSAVVLLGRWNWWRPQRPGVTLRGLMGFEAATLAVAATLHLALASDRGAGIPEAVICLALIAGIVGHERGRVTAAIAAVAFAIFGFVVGLTFTIRSGSAADLAYHATMLPVLITTLVMLVERPSPHRIG
jgi:predicted RND superfamily exporter protein